MKNVTSLFFVAWKSVCLCGVGSVLRCCDRGTLFLCVKHVYYAVRVEVCVWVFTVVGVELR